MENILYKSRFCTMIPGVISLTDAKGDIVQVLELPLSHFETFYSLWHTAIATLAPEDTFMHAWTFNREFRQLMSQALVVAGLPNYHHLRPQQLKELLLSTPANPEKQEDKQLLPGLLFRLHSEEPSPKSLIPKNRVPLARSFLGLGWLGGFVQRRLSNLHSWIGGLLNK